MDGDAHRFQKFRFYPPSSLSILEWVLIGGLIFAANTRVACVLPAWRVLEKPWPPRLNDIADDQSGPGERLLHACVDVMEARDDRLKRLNARRSIDRFCQRLQDFWVDAGVVIVGVALLLPQTD